jgi:hypothetical protein
MELTLPDETALARRGDGLNALLQAVERSVVNAARKRRLP